MDPTSIRVIGDEVHLVYPSPIDLGAVSTNTDILDPIRLNGSEDSIACASAAFDPGASNPNIQGGLSPSDVDDEWTPASFIFQSDGSTNEYPKFTSTGACYNLLKYKGSTNNPGVIGEKNTLAGVRRLRLRKISSISGELYDFKWVIRYRDERAAKQAKGYWEGQFGL